MEWDEEKKCPVCQLRFGYLLLRTIVFHGSFGLERTLRIIDFLDQTLILHLRKLIPKKVKMPEVIYLISNGVGLEPRSSYSRLGVLFKQVLPEYLLWAKYCIWSGVA